ncbi:hypothetical protein [Nocardiopsis alba]|uniref:hypothetical protein n=1 Tax=Nocardiopsis alba TaxID=53437 RepID=UPI0033A0E102
MARLSIEMQMASTMATSDHTPEQVQEWAQSLVAEGMWGEQAEVVAVDPGRIDPAVPEIAFKYDGTVERTARVIEANGFAIDRPLWDRDAAKCSPCHPGSSCH